MGKSLEDIVRPMPRQRIWHRMFTSCITLNRGWRVYKSYDVAFSGLSLASLYFTVLAFHHLTVGELKRVCVNVLICTENCL